MDLYNKWVIEICNQEYRGQLGETIKAIRRNSPKEPIKVDMRSILNKKQK